MTYEVHAHGLWMLVSIAVIPPPLQKLFGQAGFSPWLSLLVLIPVVNLVTLYIVAFSRWPALPERNEA